METIDVYHHRVGRTRSAVKKSVASLVEYYLSHGLNPDSLLEGVPCVFCRGDKNEFYAHLLLFRQGQPDRVVEPVLKYCFATLTLFLGRSEVYGDEDFFYSQERDPVLAVLLGAYNRKGRYKLPEIVRKR